MRTDFSARAKACWFWEWMRRSASIQLSWWGRKNLESRDEESMLRDGRMADMADWMGGLLDGWISGMVRRWGRSTVALIRRRRNAIAGQALALSGRGGL